MALECGIVGLPNVGKSTIFSALTAAPAAAENFPFCTIDPNIGIVDSTTYRYRSFRTYCCRSFIIYHIIMKFNDATV